jgi:hypothetical protein
LKKLFRRKFKTYEIHFEDEDLNLTATRTTESWRPKTGHLYLAPKKEFNFAVPTSRKVSVSYNHDDKQINTSFRLPRPQGNNSIMELFNHWYWSRAEIGPYNVIASEMIAEKEFNNEYYRF